MLCWENCYTWGSVCIPGPTPSDLTRQILSPWLDRALSLLREEFLCSAPRREMVRCSVSRVHHEDNGSTDISGVLALRVVRTRYA